MSPPTGWQRNVTTREWITYSSKYDCWVNETGERVTRLDNQYSAWLPSRASTSGNPEPPLRRGSEASGEAANPSRSRDTLEYRPAPSAKAPGNVPRGRNVTFSSSDPASTPLGSPNTAPASRAAQVSTGPRDIVARDKVTGEGTHWQISAAQQYVDTDTSQKRSVSLKYVLKDTDVDRHASSKSKDDMVSSKKGRAFGKVIQVRIVPPPPQTGVSAASGRSPNPPGEEGLRVSMRRFVVVEERPGGRECFRAIAIKTYGGEGVNQQIKFHHSQIYVGKDVPDIRADEQPVRRGKQMERPMQPRAIRVRPWIRTTKLDDLSRLDYCDRHDFDYGDPKVTIFGWVHEDFEEALRMQYEFVMRAVRASIRGPSSISYTGEPVASPEPQGRATSSAVASTGKSAAASMSKGTGTSGAPLPLRHHATAPTRSKSGPEKVSMKDLMESIDELRDFADRNDLEWRFKFSQNTLNLMASNRDKREEAFVKMRQDLKKQRQEAAESDDDDDGEDEGSN